MVDNPSNCQVAKVFAVLLKHDVVPCSEWELVRHSIVDDGTRELRVLKGLGFGGKLRHTYGRFYIDCYQEDWNRSTRATLRKVNKDLDEANGICAGCSRSNHNLVSDS